jgi:AcrR family transcriptional regulator
MSDTRARLFEAAADTVREDGVAAASARIIAARAGVNQALVFYHFGTVSELVEAACRQAVDEAAGHYRLQFAGVTTVAGLLEIGRELDRRERDTGNVAMMAQLMSGAAHNPVLATASRYAMDVWAAELEPVLARLLVGSPLAELVDVPGLTRLVTASFIGLQLYEDVDPASAGQALGALERLAVLVDVVTDLGPVARRAVRARLRAGRITPSPSR